MTGKRTTFPSDLSGGTKDQQFRCKNCGEWVPAYFYDSIQERCIECRAKIYCDECRKEIAPNEIFQKCIDCKSVFCLECAERVYDFIQKKCMSCRVTQVCDICHNEAKPTESFSECPNCQKICCKDHFDYHQGLCTECRKDYTCSYCDRKLLPEDSFLCQVCKQTFCVEHYDIGRKTCKRDAKEEICAKCGSVLQKEDPANLCDNCGFMYCTKHYSEFHEMCVVCLPKLECSACGKDLSKERFYKCTDCQQVFCKDDFQISVGRCLECAEKVISPTISTINMQTSSQNTVGVYELQANTIQPIIMKYNNGEVLEPEEIAFLMQHQINLPSDEGKYVNIGEIQNKMVLIRKEDNRPYVVLVPESPLHLDIKYYGDLFRKLISYLPEVPVTIDGLTSIVNLVFYGANNPRWALIYEMLQQTLLKIGIEVLQVLILIFRKADIDIITDVIGNSILESTFSGTSIKEAIKFIQTNDSEDEVGLFSSDERLDQLLKVFYNIHRGNVLRAAELLAIFEINP
jgi:hypothetical protein